MKRLVLADRLVTCDEARASANDPLGAMDAAAIVIDGEAIARVSRQSELGADANLPVVARSALVTPALVDTHTHAAWVGSRHGEYAVRMAGGDYVAIAAAGGGIAATQRAVASATEEELARALTERLARMAKLGVATVEVKSGYGLLPALELKLLRAIARAAERRDLPRVVPTFLGLHAIPRDFGASREAYVAAAIELVAQVAREGLARFVDAYIDPHAFTVEEARRFFARGADAGLDVRAHVGQFGDVGGAELAAEFRAASVDHLEHVSERGIHALASAGVAACLLPVASFTLGQAPPPVEALRAAGVPLVVASDANPGTAPTESLPLALAFAVRTYGLTPSEALLGATRNAARTLRGRATGRLAVGDPADFAAWDLPHETCILQPWGAPRTIAVVRDGSPIA